MVDFVFFLHSAFRTKTNSGKNYVRRAPPANLPVSCIGGFATHAPDAFGLNTPSELIIGYHQFITNVEYRIDQISKTKYGTKKTHELKNI